MERGSIKKILKKYFYIEDLEFIRAIIAWLIVYSGLGLLVSKLIYKKKPFILLYHSIGGSKDVFWDNKISVNTLNKQFKYLSKNRTVVSLEQIVELVIEEKPIPADWIAITFDDGYKDYLLNAYPLLLHYSYPATIYICSDTLTKNAELFFDTINRLIIKTQKQSIKIKLSKNTRTFKLKTEKQKRDAILKITLHLREQSSYVRKCFLDELAKICNVPLLKEENKLYLTFDDIKKLDDSTTIACHSASHPNLSLLDEAGINTELLESKKALQKASSRNNPIDLFSYPFGKSWSYSNKVKRALKKNGYRCAVTTSPKDLNTDIDIFELPRIGASKYLSIFKLNLSGIPI